MSKQLVKDLIDSGIHFGHRASRWNPKMKPYIYGKRNLIHIINIKETVKGLLLARKFVTQTVAAGKDVLFVGTKRQARKAVSEHASRVGMHWVNDRWLGGTLTNFHEIRKRIGRLDQLEQMEADGLLDAYSKKEGASLRREMRKIRRNLGGIRKMEKFPGVMVVIDVKREKIAVREANKMKIPVIGLLDTDCDPDVVDIPIPGNDDAMRAIELVVNQIVGSIEEGIRGRAEQVLEKSKEQPEQPKRSRRTPTARAGDETAPLEDNPTVETPVEDDAAVAQAAPVETEQPVAGEEAPA